MGSMEFVDYGKNFFDTLAEAQTFEAKLAPSIKKWSAEFKALDEKSERLGAELAEARAEAGKVQASAFADLRERRLKSSSEALAMFGVATEKRRAATPDEIGIEVADGLRGKARSIALDIHGRAVEILKLELEQARANAAKFAIAELPFQTRRQMARKVGLALFDVGGISLKFQTADYGLDETRRWITQAEVLERSLAVLDGKGNNLDGPIGYSAPGPEETLGAAAVLPASALGQLVECWEKAVATDAARVALTFNVDQVLRFKFLKKTTAREAITTHDMVAFDIQGEVGNGKRRRA